MIHLQSKHKIKVKSVKSIENIGEPSKSKVAKIESFFKPDKEPLGEVISKLVAVDGLTFRQVPNSILLRRAFKADGYNIPMSPQNVRDLFMKEFQSNIDILTKKVKWILESEGRFLLSFDESTSVRNRRYINLNLHKIESFDSLGMIMVKGSLSSQATIDLVKKRLLNFSLNVDNHIIATITDGLA